MANSEYFRFGLFRFDVATRELRREDALVHLQAQPAQVLLCLLEHAGHVVSREELHKIVWGSETFVDFDRGLNFCMAQIRSALGDDPAQPTYIRTLPRRGYQFIAPVERIPAQVSTTRNTTIPAKAAKKRLLASALAAGSLLVVGFAVTYWWRTHRSSTPSPIVAVVRFDNETSNPETTHFSDGLTDNVVEQLTSLSHERYRVIGNAEILRQPRDQRDLNAIGSALHAAYIVLGQVQRSGDGDRTRILAHLIRLPEQTHIGVVRIERPLADPLALEAEAAQKIATEFSSKLAADAQRRSSLVAENR